MNSRLPFALLLLLPLLAIPAARADGKAYVGPYAGSTVLLARLNPKRTEFRDLNARNDRDLGWKGLVGVRMSPHFAFEAGYTDFGKGSGPAVAANSPVTARTQVFTAYGVGIVPVGKVDLFAKAGPTRMQSIGHVGGSYFDDQQRRITYGAGVQLAKRRLVWRAEYEKFGNASVGKLDTVSLGFRLSFRPLMGY